eukprot:COSAG02_NODE_15464_length_1168_cov_2.865295_1_plen_260_part_00
MCGALEKHESLTTVFCRYFPIPHGDGEKGQRRLCPFSRTARPVIEDLRAEARARLKKCGNNKTISRMNRRELLDFLDCIEDRELADTYRTQQNRRSGRRANRQQPSLTGLFGNEPELLATSPGTAEPRWSPIGSSAPVRGCGAFAVAPTIPVGGRDREPGGGGNLDVVWVPPPPPPLERMFNLQLWGVGSPNAAASRARSPSRRTAAPPPSPRPLTGCPRTLGSGPNSRTGRPVPQRQPTACGSAIAVRNRKIAAKYGS